MNAEETQHQVLPEFVGVWQETLNWQPNAAQYEQFQQLYQQILDGNRQLNLTRITEPDDFWEKHLWDSLRGIAPFLQRVVEENPAEPDRAFQAIDIGTGAGFPGIPVAIVRPDWTVTLLDSTQKKVRFLATLAAELGLTNTRTLVDRAEQAGRHLKHREQYDLALIRAVGSASACAEYALPLLKVGGLAILYRGQWTPDETEALSGAVKQLGGDIESIDAFTTPLTQGSRTCLHLRKVKPTLPKFPRAIGIPAQHPL